MLESTMLVISDDSTLIQAVDGVVRPIAGLSATPLKGVDDAYTYPSWEHVSLVLIHLKQQGPASGVERLLRMINAARRPVATLVVGEPGDAEQALTLLQLGIADYLASPLDLDRLSYLIEVLTVRARSAVASPTASIPQAAVESPSIEIVSSSPFDDVILKDDPLMSQVRRVAPQDTTILLSGDTGTGKTRLASLIHELSGRHTEPFLIVNCAAISGNLIESELFGHCRGAYPGADRERVGRFAEVGKGTLFLDEIDALPLTIQAKLLRVVEDRIFEPVGSGRATPARARLIAASNRSLDQEVAAQRFRSDLYYRLNVIGFHLPPLRERRSIIPDLVRKFIAEFTTRNGGAVRAICPRALQILEEYDWPGNVRELRNLVERAVALSPGREIQVEDLPDQVTRKGHDSHHRRLDLHPVVPASVVANSTLAEIKRDAELARITEALEKHSNNRLRAASELGISRMTLYKKLYKYGLMQPSAGGRGDLA